MQEFVKKSMGELMPDSITDGEREDDHFVRPAEPEYDPELTEPEDSFELSKRLRMMINHIADHSSFDQRRLIQLLKDSKRYIDEVETGFAQIDEMIMRLEKTTYGKKQAGDL